MCASGCSCVLVCACVLCLSCGSSKRWDHNAVKMVWHWNLGRSPRTRRARKECGMRNPHWDPGKNIQTFLCVSVRAHMCAPYLCGSFYMLATQCTPKYVIISQFRCDKESLRGWEIGVERFLTWPPEAVKLSVRSEAVALAMSLHCFKFFFSPKHWAIKVMFCFGGPALDSSVSSLYLPPILPPCNCVCVGVGLATMATGRIYDAFIIYFVRQWAWLVAWLRECLSSHGDVTALFCMALYHFTYLWRLGHGVCVSFCPTSLSRRVVRGLRVSSSLVFMLHNSYYSKESWPHCRGLEEVSFQRGVFPGFSRTIGSIFASK